MRGLGTLVNVGTVVAGTALGLALAGRVPQQVRSTVLTGVGLATLAVGVSAFLETTNPVFPVVAVVAGGLVGELLGLEQRLEEGAEALRRRVEGDAAARSPRPEAFVEREPSELAVDAGGGGGFVEGFVTATLTFCVGALAVVGSLQDGISGDSELLVVKATLDGVVSVVYASVFGWGVGFSALSILVVQGALTALGAVAGETLLTGRMAAELEATGGVLVLGIGLRLLDLRQVPVAAYLPALVLAPVLVGVFG